MMRIPYLLAPLFFVFVHTTDVYDRNVVATLTVDNGNDRGEWERPEYCGDNSWAYAVDLKVDPNPPSAGSPDASAANAISLQCANATRSMFGGSITSQKGAFGEWYDRRGCLDGDFFTLFSLRVDHSGVLGDDTGVNSILFQCRKREGGSAYEIVADGAPWGEFGAPSEACPDGSAICGLRTRIEIPQGRLGGDDVGLADVEFYCCSD